MHYRCVPTTVHVGVVSHAHVPPEPLYLDVDAIIVQYRTGLTDLTKLTRDHTDLINPMDLTDLTKPMDLTDVTKPTDLTDSITGTHLIGVI